MATVRVYRPRAVVDLPRPNRTLIAFAQKVELKLTNNASFPNPGTIVTDLTDARTAFSAAVTNQASQKNVADACASAKQALRDALNHAKDFVNRAAEKAPPDQAKAIIESSGLRARKVVVWTRLPLVVKYGGVSGAVLLVTIGAGRCAVYYFEVSTDQKSWSACPNSLRCKTTVTGLTVGTTYSFRVRTQTPKGLGDWTDVVSFVVR